MGRDTATAIKSQLMRTQKIKDVHRLLSLMMLESCFISLAVSFKFFFMVPSVSVLTEFHCFIKSNICQKVMQTSCDSVMEIKNKNRLWCTRTQMLSIQCRLYILYPNPPSLINGGGKLPVPANDCWIRQL